MSEILKGDKKLIDDKKLVAMAQQGDNAAMAKLIDRHYHKIVGRMYGMLKNRDDAEDIAQIASINAVIDIKKFRGNSAFLTWYTRIGINAALKLIRSRTCRPPQQDKDVDEDENHNLLGHINTPEAMAELDDLSNVIRNAMDTMNPDHAKAVWLRESQGLTFKQIADRLQVPLGTARSQLHRGRRHLHACLEAAKGE